MVLAPFPQPMGLHHPPRVHPPGPGFLQGLAVRIACSTQQHCGTWLVGIRMAGSSIGPQMPGKPSAAAGATELQSSILHVFASCRYCCLPLSRHAGCRRMMTSSPQGIYSIPASWPTHGLLVGISLERRRQRRGALYVEGQSAFVSMREFWGK